MIYYLKRLFSNYKAQSITLLFIAAIITVSLATYNSSDPSFNLVTQKYPDNFLNYFGAYLSDFLYQLFGLGAFIIPVCILSWAILIYKQGKLKLLPVKLVAMALTILSFGVIFAELKMSFLPAGAGGAFGIIMRSIIEKSSLNYYYMYFGYIAVPILFLLSMGIGFEIYKKIFLSFMGNLFKYISFILPYFRKIIIGPKFADNDTNSERIAPAFDKSEGSSPQPFVQNNIKDIAQGNHTINPKIYSKPQAAAQLAKNLTTQKGAVALPSIELLQASNNQSIKIESKAELSETAEKLISVLNDFGVKGQIIDVRQGPVVTLYEFEPAAGTKSSRVIGLSDDIARSLSAHSTRIAVVPGRNVLGIELPNKQRAFFCLRELVETSEYQDPNIILPLILGKDLAGRPFVADLTKMPHLLVAGTTGSGKSVAINTMVMSLLYRYTPQECRLIMIDPKMLELSVYDNIPHLLTPVVTDSSKAIVALKWAVREMENRYRLMSNLGVRNIAGYNAKILDAIKNGEVLKSNVQTGFDPETGKPIFESVPIKMEKLPFIVIIVDEMADLMLLAGKDIESSIQRLAQMARAAGLHIIMATQRPSVDVITGVIKANFPSRISFKVISKIDSRTILGEQGAEQLLGMGDMLYMGNASKISRVHGPFVDDREVEQVTNFLRSTGVPEYVSAVTEQPDEDGPILDIIEDGDDDNSLYNKALQIVKLERKVSISYIQRCLRIGYNRAANIIEQMEKEGVVSQPNHTGKREILLPE